MLYLTWRPESAVEDPGPRIEPVWLRYNGPWRPARLDEVALIIQLSSRQIRESVGTPAYEANERVNPMFTTSPPTLDEAAASICGELLESRQIPSVHHSTPCACQADYWYRVVPWDIACREMQHEPYNRTLAPDLYHWHGGPLHETYFFHCPELDSWRYTNRDSPTFCPQDCSGLDDAEWYEYKAARERELLAK